MDLMARTLGIGSSKPKRKTKPVHPPPQIPFSRRRLSPEQLQMLQTMYETKTHPTKQDREALARELDIDFKAVSIWFQNKRRSMKKKSVAWSRVAVAMCSENASASGGGRTRAAPKTHPLLRQNPSYSLDAIVSSRERQDNRPPLEPRRQVSDYEDEYDHPSTSSRHSVPIWEHIPSSPSLPPSSPSAESQLFAGLPPESRTRRTLEWACANDRMRRRAGTLPNNDYEDDVPALELDELLDASDTEADMELDELITPDTSLQMLHVPAELGHGKKGGQRKKSRGDGEQVPNEDVEAAMALLGFRVYKA